MVFLGLIIIVSLYVLALVFHLYLTTLTLQYFFGVSVVVFVIIFQSEIRKYFETLGLLSTRQIRSKTMLAKSPSGSEIFQACVKMAQAKIGSLIVIRGSDSLDPLIEGGTLLDGEISEEVIVSMFDPHTSGHDGAMIISNNRIYKFSTHLPLSSNFSEIGKRGTRHTAALGLSERCDALCIVVSEETGQISVCINGRLKTLADPLDLEKELDKFIREKYFPKKETVIVQVFSRNLPIKISSLGAAGLLWFFTTYQTDVVTKKYSIPVEFTSVPQNIQIETISPKEILLTVSGRGEATYRGISQDSFEISLNASQIQNGINSFNLTHQDIKEPINLNLVSYSPDQILLTAKKYVSQTVPLKIISKGVPAKGFQLKSLVVTPADLEILVPENATPPSEIATETVILTDLKESTIIPARLVLPAGIKLAQPELPPVSITATIEK